MRFTNARLRIYPGYQPFDLDHPVWNACWMTPERGLILQVVFGMEDHECIIPLSTSSGHFRPLLEAVEHAEGEKFSCSISPDRPPAWLFSPWRRPTRSSIFRAKGNGAIGRMIGTITGLPSARVPIERIVFGCMPLFPGGDSSLKLIESPLDAAQLHAIMQGNARRLLPRA
jgi:hypothetical protein